MNTKLKVYRAKRYLNMRSFIIIRRKLLEICGQFLQ